MVARLLEVRRRFSIVFLTLKSRNFVKICLFFVISWIWFLAKIRLWRKCWVYKTTSSIQLNCNCQHSIERKILRSKVNWKTLFWMLWSLFLPSKKWTLEFCRILKGSCSTKDWQNTELTHYLFARLKRYKDQWVCFLKPIFACKSFICVRLFVFFHVANGVEINMKTKLYFSS